MTSILLSTQQSKRLSFPKDYINSQALCHNNLVWKDLNHLDTPPNITTMTMWIGPEEQKYQECGCFDKTHAARDYEIHTTKI